MIGYDHGDDGRDLGLDEVRPTAGVSHMHPLLRHQVARADKAATHHLERVLVFQNELAEEYRVRDWWRGDAVISKQEHRAALHVQMRFHADALAIEIAWLVRHANA